MNKIVKNLHGEVIYRVGDHITSKDGKLCIKNDKKRLIKLAEKEISKWQEFLKNLKANT